jgi:competence protein ComEA
MIARLGLVAGIAGALFFLLPLAPLAGVDASAQTATTAAPKQTIAEKIAASKELLDINTASAAQLKALPGMGDAYVARIVAGRPYTAKNQLTKRGILPAEAYDKIKPLIIAHRVK